jgi:hypothetical protein
VARVEEQPDGLVFGTDEERRKQRRSFILMVKLTLLPFLTLMGLTSGIALTGAGLPGAVGAVCSVVLMVLLPWIALRALNRRLRFWYALTPEGLEVGPRKRGWLVPYDEVALVRESNPEEVGEDRYVEVTAGSKSAKILLNPEDVGPGARAIAARCRCAVRIDERGAEHMPAALDGDLGSEEARLAIRNLSVLRERYFQVAVRFGVAFLVPLAGLLYVAAAFLGLGPMDAGLRKGWGISSVFFTGLFGYCGLMQYRQLQAWDRVCARYAEPADAPALGREG